MTLTLTGKTLLAGDYNGDSVVDAADYVAWRSTEGQSVVAFSAADGNGDGLIDAGDFDVWRANFGLIAAGSGSAIGTQSIPEPASAMLISIAAIALLARRRGRPG